MKNNYIENYLLFKNKLILPDINKDIDFDILSKIFFNMEDKLRLKCLIYIRDKNNGLKLKEVYYKGIKWFIQNDKETIKNHIKDIPKYGYWKDYLNIWEYDNDLRNNIIYILTKQLKKDIDNYNLKNYEDISNVAKWVPSEKGEFDKIYGIVNILCEELNCSKKTYRKNNKKLREIIKNKSI